MFSKKNSIRQSVSRLRSLVHPGDFPYRELDTSKNEIRLLRLDAVQSSPAARRYSSSTGNGNNKAGQTETIVCTLFKTSLINAPSFTALSYTWGTATPGLTLLIDKVPFMITSNLHQALLHLHKAKHEYIWVDAICINQGDKLEKSHQILRLANVFRSAETVVAWIGLHDESSKIVFEYLRSPEARGPNVSTATNPLLRLALTAFSKRDYWSRVWVVQEFAVAKEVHVMCENDVFNAKEIDTLIIVYDKLFGHFGGLWLESLFTLSTIRDRQRDKENIGLLDVLRHTTSLSTGHRKYDATNRNMRRMFKSTDIIDQIYGLLGLVDDAAFFVPEPDYELTMNELSVYMLKSAVTNTRRLDFILLECGNKPLRHADFGSKENREYKPANLPSWCPDFVSILDSTLNSELIYAVFPSETVSFHSLDVRQGKTELSWRAMAGQKLEKDLYFFTDDNTLHIRGQLLGSIVTLEQAIAMLKGYLAGEFAHEPLSWIPELLMTYSNMPVPSANEVLQALPRIFDGTVCGCKHSKHCADSRKETRDELTTNATPGDLAPLLMKFLAPRPGTSAIMPDPQDFTWSKRQGAIAHAVARSTWLNYFTFRRKVMALGPNRESRGVTTASSLDGRIGWTPVDTEPGDEVWLLPGCSMPVVLRKVSKDHKTKTPQFRKIGPAVVHNAMWGGMSKDPSVVNLEWIAIV